MAEEYKKYIIGQFRYYVHRNNIEIICELDLSDAANNFICREGFYGQDVYDACMTQTDLIVTD